MSLIDVLIYVDLIIYTLSAISLLNVVKSSLTDKESLNYIYKDKLKTPILLSFIGVICTIIIVATKLYPYIQ